MNPFATLARTLPLPPLDDQDRAALRQFADLARQVSYTEAGLNDLLGVPDLHHIWMKEVLGLRRRHAGSTLSRWVNHFLLADPDGPDLPDPVVRVLDKLGMRAARASLFPCQDLVVLTDPFITELNFQHAVYRLGGDSHALARLTPRHRVARSLDLCTGSGIHALLASRHADEATGIDLNPRAVQFAQVNAAMNSSHARFQLSDLYAACSGQYDLITANPPFVPTPESGSELFRSGGPDGEGLVRRIVEGLPQYLAPGGTFAMVTHYPQMLPPLFERLRSWLGPGRWGIGVLNYARFTSERYIAMNLRADLPVEEQTRAYLDSYAELGITGVVEAVIFIVRDADFGSSRDLPLPPGPLPEMAAGWLRALAHPPTGEVRRHRELDRLLVDEQGAGVALHRSRAWAPAGVELSPAEVGYLRSLPAPAHALTPRLAAELLVE